MKFWYFCTKNNYSSNNNNNKNDCILMKTWWLIKDSMRNITKKWQLFHVKYNRDDFSLSFFILSLLYLKSGQKVWFSFFCMVRSHLWWILKTNASGCYYINHFQSTGTDSQWMLSLVCAEDVVEDHQTNKMFLIIQDCHLWMQFCGELLQALRKQNEALTRKCSVQHSPWNEP